VAERPEDRRRLGLETLGIDIHEALRAVVLKNGLSRYRLVKESGVDAATIDRFVSRERDRRLPQRVD